MLCCREEATSPFGRRLDKKDVVRYRCVRVGMYGQDWSLGIFRQTISAPMLIVRRTIYAHHASCADVRWKYKR